MTQLKKKRKEKKLRLREIADALGVSIITVWQKERDGIKTVKVARKYAEVLGCDWQDLID